MVAPMDMEPTVFIVDESPRIRSQIEQVLESAKIHSESFRSSEQFLIRYEASLPGCLVLDSAMKGQGGVEFQRELLTRGIRIPVIVISEVAAVREVVSAIRAGAIDFLEKPIQEVALLRAVSEAFARDRDRRQDEARLASLTRRESQVLNLLVAGENYKEVAARLQVSPKTVEGHRVNLLRKLGFRSVVEAVKFVLERRLS
jgi:FixJ family two-component response regulator